MQRPQASRGVFCCRHHINWVPACTLMYRQNIAVHGCRIYPYVSEDAIASVSLAAVLRPWAASRAPLGQLMRPDYVTFNNLINF